MNNYKITLGSKSPRRQNLLKEMGYGFELKTKDTDESFPAEMPSNEVAEFIAIKKAMAFKDEIKENELVITADTIVVHQGVILGKPANEKEARNMISKLSNSEHTVLTGVCLFTQDKLESFTDESIVHIEQLNEEEINFYIENFQPYDKAGAYGIQEWFGHNKIKKIIGSYTNIMGLPTAKLYESLVNF